ncbi:MAG: sodium:calcium antiporter [Halobacteria archaeon]
MSLLLDGVLLAAGFALILKGGGLFVDSAVRIAARYRLPRAFVGMTLVSFATTTPEFVVSATGAWLGNTGIAYGNAVGSAIVNIGLILAILLLGSAIVPDSSSRISWLVMAGAGLLVLLLAADGGLERPEGALFLGLLALFLIRSTGRALSGREPPAGSGAPAGPASREWLRFLAGTGMVVGGARLLVHGAASLALSLGVPEVVLGLTLVAVGTSLPELVVAVTSLLRRVSDISLGNIAGANLLNFLWILGASSVIRDIPVGRDLLLRDGAAMMGVMLIPALFMALRRPLGRAAGLLLLGLYAAYLALLLSGPVPVPGPG